jgi:hypothetical protein
MRQVKRQRRTRPFQYGDAIVLLSELVGRPENDLDRIFVFAFLVAIKERCNELDRPAFSGLTPRQYAHYERTAPESIGKIISYVGAFERLSNSSSRFHCAALRWPGDQRCKEGKRLSGLLGKILINKKIGDYCF